MLSKPLLYVFDHQIISLMFRPRGINFLFSKSTDNPLQKLVKCLHYDLKQNSFKLLRFKCVSNMNMANDLKMLKTLCTNINSLSTSNFSNYEENLKRNYKSAGLRINYVPEVSNLSCNYYSNSLIHNDTVQDQTKSIKSIRKLIGELTVDERRDILLDLQLEEAAVRKKEAEEKLASWHWRSKFGRPTSVHPSTVDPSGTYCEIPQDWLIKKVAESVKINPPTFSDLRKHW
ncbi:hypothetical protein Avbf_01314 [Armadillidium vulgare]|nr:hypothetical protein Avbf_01314 [Armadillidium vulgare]